MTWTLGEVVTSTAGTVIGNPDGTVRSLNPTHGSPPYGPYSFSSMPAGTAGPYELVIVSAGTVVYNPTGNEPIVFGFAPEVPNRPGLCAVTTEPLA